MDKHVPSTIKKHTEYNKAGLKFIKKELYEFGHDNNVESFLYFKNDIENKYVFDGYNQKVEDYGIGLGSRSVVLNQKNILETLNESKIILKKGSDIFVFDDQPSFGDKLQTEMYELKAKILLFPDYTITKEVKQKFIGLLYKGLNKLEIYINDKQGNHATICNTDDDPIFGE